MSRPPPRLHLDAPLAEGGEVALAAPQAHYLATVLRLPPGAPVLAFNGRDGEFAARLAGDRKRPALALGARARPPDPPGGPWLLMALLKGARMELAAEKATELGAARIAPVLARRSQGARANEARLRASAVEAAEQCGRVSVPGIAPAADLAGALAALPGARRLVLLDEAAPVADPLAALRALAPGEAAALLVGPEGGLAPEERALALARPGALRLSLGPRVLRAETAAAAGLALLQAAAGDWRG